MDGLPQVPFADYNNAGWISRLGVQVAEGDSLVVAPGEDINGSCGNVLIEYNFVAQGLILLGAAPKMYPGKTGVVHYCGARALGVMSSHSVLRSRGYMLVVQQTVGPAAWVVEALKALPVFIIGLIAAFIAWRQYLTARAKLKLDLFEKRYALFEATWRFLSEVVWDEEPPGPLSPINNLVPQAGFLFGSKIKEYLGEINRKSTELWGINQRAKANQNIIAPDDVSSRLNLMKWFHNEATAGAEKMFAPFMEFERWR